MKDKKLIIIAGSCSAESVDESLRQAKFLTGNNIDYMRFMMWKPRTRRLDFQGIGEEKGLKILEKVNEKYPNLTFVTEVMNQEHITLLENSKFNFIYQVGSRNGQNFDLLKRLGELNNATILYKRGMWMGIDEYIEGSKYLEPEKNNILLCLRGIKTWSTSMRNTPDIGDICVLKDKLQFSTERYSVLFDPSHVTGNRNYIRKVCFSAIVAGAEGIEIEIHSSPDSAFTDSQQTISFKEFEDILYGINELKTLTKKLDERYSNISWED